MLVDRNPIWVKRATPINCGGYEKLQLRTLQCGINTAVEFIAMEEIIDLVGVVLFTSFDCDLEVELNADTECFDSSGDLCATFLQLNAHDVISEHPEHVLYIPRWDLNKCNVIGDRAVVDVMCVASPYSITMPYSIKRSITNAISYLAEHGCDTLYIPYNSTGAWGMDVRIMELVLDAIAANRKCFQKVYLSIKEYDRCAYLHEFVSGMFTDSSTVSLED